MSGAAPTQRGDCFVSTLSVSYCVCQLGALFTSFRQLLRCANKRIVNIMKVYIESSNMHVELIRFRKKYLLYSRFRLRIEEFIAISLTEPNSRELQLPESVYCHTTEYNRYNGVFAPQPGATLAIQYVRCCWSPNYAIKSMQINALSI